MDTAPVTHFSSTLPLDVDLRPRSPATAEELPVDEEPYYYADYVNVALGVCPTFFSSVMLLFSLGRGFVSKS